MTNTIFPDISLAQIEQWLLPVSEFLPCRTPDSWIQVAIQPENLSVILIDHLICELKAAQTAALLLRKYVLTEKASEVLLGYLLPFEDYIYRQKGSIEALKGLRNFSKAQLALRDTLSTTMFHTPQRTATMNHAKQYELAEQIVQDMVLLIKEELHHFIQVLEIMQERGVEYRNLTASRYAKGLMQGVRTHEPMTLVDKLICGAYIEARSCERFASLAPHVDKTLSTFYISLLRSEARHYQDYLNLAAQLMQNVNSTDSNTSIEALIAERVAYFGALEKQLILSTDPMFRFHSGVPTMNVEYLN